VSRKDYLILFLLSVVVITTVGLVQKSAGYMDAEYYAVTGKGLISGNGLIQNFLWNYLDDPIGIPHPANTYWMPLASILSAISLSFRQGDQKTTLWVVQILFSSLIPLATAMAGFSFTSRRSDGWMSGLLGLFSGFYLLYYAIPETFSLEMVFGFLLVTVLALQLSGGIQKRNWLVLWGIAGILAGLLHLARAEGLIWFLISLGCLAYLAFKVKKLEIILSAFGLLILGYLLVSALWYGRNISLWGSIFPPGSNRTLWMTNYDQTFLFPASALTFHKWIQQGVNSIARVRLDALWMNIKSAIAVQGGILLVPFIIAGLLLKRLDKRLILAGIYYGLIFILMTLVFPFAGARGGFIHSAAGVQIFFWAIVPVGLDRFVNWGNLKRNWKIEQARRVFQIGIVSIMVLLSGIIFYQRVIATTNGISNWLQDEAKYQQLWLGLVKSGDLAENDVAMVKNPPGWNLVTDIPAIVIPDGGVEAVRMAASKFGAKLLIIDKDHPKAMDNFYQGREEFPDFKLIFSLDDVKVYRFSPVQ
jgi:hypothetical protein